uniref:Uncharacterized protein n=1 Tax=Favella ehrenbergii TaxID=182087 RepID=A0A7S3HX20_9SPIT|mmetsp:Transcript_1693/g.2459  ORF Transcript_1693/g.2459 Transcript_1693/m.2459 type:complete len:103 (+) Transcript_1693:3-311(+)
MKRLAKQYDPLLEASIDSIIDSSLEDPVTVLDGSQLREPSIITVEAVPLSVLEEVYREGRKRLQMCQSSLLFKYNDDKNKIFGVLKKELEVTFESLKQAVFI